MFAAMITFAALTAPSRHPRQHPATAALFALQDSVTCVSNTQQSAPEAERMTGA
jgi:hypothetical protein